MKKMSLRFRIAILTSILIALTSLSMNFFMNKTAYFYIDSLGGYVDRMENKENLYINIDKDKMGEFQNTFSDQVTNTKDNFSKKILAYNNFSNNCWRNHILFFKREIFGTLGQIFQSN